VGKRENKKAGPHDPAYKRYCTWLAVTSDEPEYALRAFVVYTVRHDACHGGIFWESEKFVCEVLTLGWRGNVA
jgi:hypothetical protein